MPNWHKAFCIENTTAARTRTAKQLGAGRLGLYAPKSKLN